MDRKHKLFTWFRVFCQKETFDARMDDEMRSHIEMQTQENIDSGMQQEEARYAALRQFGWVESIKNTCRAERGASWIENLGQDARFGLRMLRKNPGFTMVAVITLALGIGANTAIFSFVNAILLRPLPYPESERIVQLSLRNIPRGHDRFGVSLPNFMDWKQQSHSFESLAYYRQADFHLASADWVVEAAAARVSASFFDVLGTHPELGRVFLPEEDVPGSSQPVLLSHALWQRHFGGDPKIVGQAISVEGEMHLVCGVMPAGFSFPELCDLWLPYGASMEQLTRKRNDHVDSVIGRLKRGVKQSTMETEMATIAARLATQYPDSNMNISVLVRSLRESMVGSFKPALLLLFGAVATVLLIASVNVANLQLARGIERQKELAVRTALGAGRGRIIRQLLVESLVLSVAGALLGLMLAKGSLTWIATFAPADLPHIHETTLDGTVLTFTCLVAVLTGIVFGLLPAIQGSRLRLTEGLFPDQNPLGKQLFVEGQGERPYSIVGVVGATRGLDLTQPSKPQIYFSYQQINVGSMWLVVRGASRMANLERVVEDEVRALDPNQPAGIAQTINEQLHLSTQLPRFRTFLLTMLAALALLLAVAGIYGVIAYTVTLKRREMGVRMALGAEGRDILRLILGQGGKLALIGISAGIGISLWLARFTATMLYEIKPLDFATFATVSGLIMIVALIACWLPARRASRVDPMEALRYE